MTKSNVVPINSRSPEDPKWDHIVTHKAREAEKRMYRRRRMLAGGVALTGVALVSGAIGVVRNQQSNANRFRSGQVADANEAVNNGTEASEALNEVMVLRPGVKLRTAPLGGDDRVAHIVGKNELVVVNRPRVDSDSQGAAWYEFTGTDKDKHLKAGQDYFVDYDELLAQEAVESRSYIEFYNYPQEGVNSQTKSDLLDVTINDHGQAVTQIGNEQVLLGQASTVDEKTLQQLIAMEGLTRDDLH